MIILSYGKYGLGLKVKYWVARFFVSCQSAFHKEIDQISLLNPTREKLVLHPVFYFSCWISSKHTNSWTVYSWQKKTIELCLMVGRVYCTTSPNPIKKGSTPINTIHKSILLNFMCIKNPNLVITLV